MTLEEALKHSDNGIGYPDIFPIDIGKDFIIPDKLNIKCKINNPRNVCIRITTFRGISWNAIHYYGTIIADGVNWIDEYGSYLGGYISKWFSENKNDLYESKYDIHLLRELTQEEIDKDPDRWNFYEAGDMVSSFNTIKEIEDLAIEVAKIRFPGWNIEFDYD